MFTPKSTDYEERERARAMNAAPDSIVGMFKPGEFVLPPDTVHAMGGKQALQGVVDATHTPVAGGLGLRRRPPEPAAKPEPGLGLHRAMLRSADPVEAPQLGLRPRVFFANGGAPEDQIQQPGMAAKPSAAPSPSNTFPGNRLPGSSGFSSAPAAPAAAAPQPAPAGMSDSQRADALAQIPTDGPKAPAADGSQDAWSNTEAGRNFGNAVASLPGLGGAGRVASTGGAISRSFNAASTAANNAGRAVVGAGVLGGASPAAATSADPVVPASTAGAGRGSINPPLVNPGAAAPAVASTPPAPSNQVMDEVYNHGRGQYSDQAGGMGFPAGFTGKPNAQNNAAAGALAQSEAGGFGLKRPVQPEPGGFGLHAPTVSHSGNDWAARQRLKNLETSASSIMNTQRWGGKGAAHNPAAQNFLDASRADLAAQGK